MTQPVLIGLSRSFIGGENAFAILKNRQAIEQVRKKPVKTARLLILVSGLGLLIILLLPAPQPSYQGIRLGRWLQDLDFGTRTGQATTARFAIQQMGTNCVPALIDYLRRHDSPMKRR